ncbi:YTH domain-containing family protein 2 [Hibiscus syriacus]|uniref:YTH domain-containing family protein n=1 Tax=Hibiscus syriacus TaxID=106335 RepID=A0A6A2ZFR3_HIBSY|nr:YTH domain-containing protein ECT3-like [Hibiscus syriacus]KAE8690851.1 YTH domain-containing family protein 2 [Hibiscus syriacus]
MPMAHHSSDRLTSTESAEVFNVLVLDSNNVLANPNALTNKDGSHQSGFVQSVVDSKTSYLSNAYSPDTELYQEAHKQGSLLPYVNAKGLDNGFHDIYNGTSTLGFHGLGHTPQMSQRSYTPVSSYLPPVGDPSCLSDGRHFVTLDSSYHYPSIPRDIPLVTSKAQISHLEFPVNIEQQVVGKRFGLRPNYLPQSGSFGGESNFFGSSTNLCSSYQGSDRFAVGGFCPDMSKPFNGKSSLFHPSYPTASTKRVGLLGISSNDLAMASFQKGSFSGFGSCSGSNSRGYSGSQSDQSACHGRVSTSSLGISGHNWSTLDEARQGGSCNDFSCSCTVTLDTLSERNRGPRAFKPKTQINTKGYIVDSSKNGTTNGITNGSYSRQNFATDYEGAMFFVIKSYSEDNVHKSIKYGVWASTPTGNKKLDTAYHEAKAKQGTCPVFLLFSVNASAQFCGVAEMVGPVDFDKSVDYWLQNKWSGQFPVKWHMIKDVPNSQFRHILLENNDNKPVTNSRDTQEVEFEQGIEMINIFKNYESRSSILDDFHFYEERQKAMLERKARQLTTLVASDLVRDAPNLVSLPNDFVKKMSKSFSEVLLLNENEKAAGAAKKVLSAACGGHGR